MHKRSQSIIGSMFSSKTWIIPVTLLTAILALQACLENEQTPLQFEPSGAVADEMPELALGDPKAIYYGQTSPTLYSGMSSSQQNAVMALYFRHYEAGFCTCTLISPRVILTAAHCIKQEDMGVLRASDIEVRVGSNSASPEDVIYPSQVYYNTSWNGQERNDVAIIILGSPYYGATPIPIKRGGLSGLLGEDTQSTGFGRTQNSSDYNPNTRRYWTTMPVEYIDSNAVTVNGYGSTGIGPGDSGGPLIYDFGDGIQVVGVASTAAEGWVYQGNYSSLQTNENWVQNYVDQYDNPECYDACRYVDCGDHDGCYCGGCDRGYECQGNDCVEIQAGEGGVCVTLQPTTDECSQDSDCGSGAGCIRYEGGVSECGEECEPELCNPNDPSSICMPIGIEGGGYMHFCIEDSPQSCSNEGGSCQTSDGRPGLCAQLYQNGPRACYGYCEPVVTCPLGTTCIEHHITDCDDLCESYECGTVRGCDCGSCPDGFRCVRNHCEDDTCIPDCDGRQCGPDGCEGSCGECSSGEYCDDNGICRCSPDCTGKQCGPDGCGGSCGECYSGQACEEFICVDVGPCLGACVYGEMAEYCIDDEMLCTCSTASTKTGVDCNDVCGGTSYHVCGVDPESGSEKCICEAPVDGDTPEDGDTPLDGDTEDCIGACQPLDPAFCINDQTACLCSAMKRTATNCAAFCRERGQESTGCGFISIIDQIEGCICNDPVDPLDGDTPDGDISDGDLPDGDLPDGDFPDDDDDEDDGNNQSGSGSGGCSQNGGPSVAWLLAGLMIWLGRRRFA